MDAKFPQAEKASGGILLDVQVCEQQCLFSKPDNYK